MIFDWRAPAGVTRAVLVRHGAPEASFAGRCYGALDVGLSSDGAAQAERAAAWLGAAPLVAVYASPRRRALATAAPIAAARGLSVEVRAALREIDFGRFEGLSYDEAAAQHPALYAEWMARPTEVTFPEGESFAILRARVLAEIAALRHAHRGTTFALVAHGGPLRALLADALGLAAPDIFRIDQSYAGISVIDWFGESATLRFLNATV